MSEYEEIRDKLNTIIQFCKANTKLCKGFAEYLSNVSVKVDGELEDLRKTVDEIKDEVLKLNKLREAEKHVYSDEEIYRLKKVMSWCRLSEKTDIPLSTLQYRHKRYTKKLSADQATADIQD